MAKSMVHDYWSHWYFISVVVTKIIKKSSSPTMTMEPPLRPGHRFSIFVANRMKGVVWVKIEAISPGFWDFLSEYIWNFSVLAFSWLFAILDSGLAFYGCEHFLVTSHTQNSFQVTCFCWKYEAPIDCWFVVWKPFTWIKFVTCRTPGSLQGTCSTCWRGRELRSICTSSPSSCCGPANLHSCLPCNHYCMQF